MNAEDIGILSMYDCALFTLGGEEYVTMPQVLRYGDRWYISTMNSVAAMLCGVSSTNCAFFKLSDLQQYNDPESADRVEDG
jgi:hypothetical protein